MTTTTQLSEIYQEDERLQYDGKDGDRIKAVAEGVTVYSIAAIEALGGLSDVLLQEPSEDAVYQTRVARQEVVEAYAHLAHSIQKMAWSLRIDADEAATRLLQAIKTGEPVSMAGL